jgi:hypothetical protein
MVSWLGTITFWALLPLAILLGAFFIAVIKADKLILALLIGVPVMAVVCDVVLYVLFIPIAWLRASSIKSKVDSGNRRLKLVVREVS